MDNAFCQRISRISWREMSSLHEAARDGQLDECRRLVEKEGKDVNEYKVFCMISSICIN
jgi:hypothetical protein